MGDREGSSTELIGRDRSGQPVIRQFTLTGWAAPGDATRYESTTDRVIVGTHSSCDLVLPDPAVSRFHCALQLVGAEVHIEDLGSSNGTLVDRVKVLRAVVHSGATISVGRTHLRFDLGTTHAPLPISAGEQFGDLVGKSLAMRATFLLLERAAASDATVLLEGPTGTGKDLAAESIHLAGPRARGPFVTVDCGSLPPALLESELFGHERGAFTGAHSRREGAFQSASGGTIFLDEIGELGGELQPKLLRALESREVKMVGATRYVPIDVRIIAATNRDLRADVNAGLFRTDLFFRLAVLPIRLPSLRERADDLPLLLETFLARLGAADTPEAAALRRPEVVAELAQYPWPGNLRELRNYVERCLAVREFLHPGGLQPLAGIAADGERASFGDARAQFERTYLEALMREFEDNVSAAARAARVERMFLHRLLRRHGLRP